MNIYTIYTQKKSPNFENAKYIPEGFSFKAFFFNFFWLLYHRIWLALICFSLIVLILLNLTSSGSIENTVFFSFTFGICIYLGYSGYDLFRWQLEKRDYQLYDIIAASSEEDAEIRFLQNYINKNDRSFLRR